MDALHHFVNRFQLLDRGANFGSGSSIAILDVAKPQRFQQNPRLDGLGRTTISK